MGSILKFLAILLLLMTVPVLSEAQAASRTVDKGVTVVRGGEDSPAKPRTGFAGECEAAESGDPQAAYKVARRYLFGRGVAKNRRVGTAWLRAAASRGPAPR